VANVAYQLAEAFKTVAFFNKLVVDVNQSQNQDSDLDQ